MSFSDCSHISPGIVSITQYCVNFVSCEESLVVTTSLRNTTNTSYISFYLLFYLKSKIFKMDNFINICCKYRDGSKLGHSLR